MTQNFQDSHLGRGAVLTGRLEASGPFHVNGAFVGEILRGQLVSVGADGVVEGEIHAARIVLNGGTVKGLLKAESIEIRSSSTITDSRIVAEHLQMDPGVRSDGARFDIGGEPRADLESPPNPV